MAWQTTDTWFDDLSWLQGPRADEINRRGTAAWWYVAGWQSAGDHDGECETFRLFAIREAAAYYQEGAVSLSSIEDQYARYVAGHEPRIA